MSGLDIKRTTVVGVLGLLTCLLAAAVLAQDNYDLGNELFAKGEFDAAAEAYQMALREADEEHAAHTRYMLALTYEKMRDFRKAEENYRLVWQLFPRSEWADDAHLRISSRLAMSPNLDEVRDARTFLIRVLHVYPDSVLIPEALCLLGEISIRLGEFEQSLENLTAVLDKHPDSDLVARAHFGLGRLYSDNACSFEDLDRAIDEFKKCIDEDPDGAYAPWAYFSIGNIFREKKKWEHARIFFQTILERYEGSFCAAAAAPILTLSQLEKDQFLRSRDSFEHLLTMMNQGCVVSTPAASRPMVGPIKILKLEIVADETYSNDRCAIYKGDVKVIAGRMKIFSNKVVCELDNQVLRSSGSTTVQFDDDFVLDCKELEFDVKTQRGVASGGVKYVDKVPGAGLQLPPKVRTASSLVFVIENGQTISLSEQK